MSVRSARLTCHSVQVSGRPTLAQCSHPPNFIASRDEPRHHRHHHRRNRPGFLLDARLGINLTGLLAMLVVAAWQVEIDEATTASSNQENAWRRGSTGPRALNQLCHPPGRSDPEQFGWPGSLRTGKVLVDCSQNNRSQNNHLALLAPRPQAAWVGRAADPRRKRPEREQWPTPESPWRLQPP